MRFMLHFLSFFHKNFRLFFLFVLLVLAGCKTDTSTDSEEETAYMADYESPSAKWGFMNQRGELVIEASYDDAGPFSEGMAAVNKNGKWGFIDKEGNMVIEPVFKSAWAFHEGFSRVLSFDQADQFINSKGIPLKADNWSAADDFSEGRARVKVGNTFGYIDSSGQLLIQPIYNRGWNFSNGICVVEFHDKIGLINMAGEYV